MLINWFVLPLIYLRKELLVLELSHYSYVSRNLHSPFLPAGKKLELQIFYNIQTRILLSTYVNLFKLSYEEPRLSKLNSTRGPYFQKKNVPRASDWEKKGCGPQLLPETVKILYLWLHFYYLRELGWPADRGPRIWDSCSKQIWVVRISLFFSYFRAQLSVFWSWEKIFIWTSTFTFARIALFTFLCTKCLIEGKWFCF
jgi:hypothetical protein